MSVSDLWAAVSGGLQAEREASAQVIVRLQNRIDELERQVQPVPPFRSQSFVADAAEKDVAWIGALYNPLLVSHTTATARVMGNRYWALDRGRFEAEIVEPWRALRLAYVDERFDCDSFAVVFRAFARLRGVNSVAEVIFQSTQFGHDFNLVALDTPDGKGELQALEPQGGQWVTLGEPIYSLTSVLVLI